MKTYATSKKEIERNWHLFDLRSKVLGKAAVEITHLLMGKHKTNYAPYLEMGDKIVVINAKKVVLTGNKEEGKVYYRHSKVVGNLKTETAAKLRALKPENIIYNAVKGMLPKNDLQQKRLANLHIYAGENHPHQAQIKR